MDNQYTRRFNRFASLIAAAMAISLFVLPCAQAQEGSKADAKAPAQAGKGKAAQTDKNKKKADPKKNKADSAQGARCTENGKQWKDGAHCMTTCNAQGTLCDMRICVKGEWKPYSSCFGAAAVAPNCPASCS